MDDMPSIERRSSIPGANKRIVLDLAYVPREKKYRCAQCRDLYPKSEVQIDHIKEWADTRDWPDEERHAAGNLQILCREDHRRKTKRSAVKRQRGAKTSVHLAGRIFGAATFIVIFATLAWLAPTITGDTAAADKLLHLYKTTGAVLAGLLVLWVAGRRLARRGKPEAVETVGNDTTRVEAWIAKAIPDSKVTVTAGTKAAPTISVKYPPHTTTTGSARTEFLEKAEDMFPDARIDIEWDTRNDKLTIRDIPDPLESTIQALPMSEIEEAANYSTVDFAVLDNGQRWRLPILANHILVGAASRAGKSAGAAWTIIRGLAPGIRDGLVFIHAIDPKGGVELSPGLPLWSRYSNGRKVIGVDGWDQYEDEVDATVEAERGKARRTVEPITPMDRHVAVLEEAVEAMSDQLERMEAKGLRKVDKPSKEFPLHLIFVDEAASILSYASDTKLKKRAQNAFEMLQSQGAAAGFSVLCLAQDPSADTMKIRDLFITKMALRLNEPGQVRMVLGDGARANGARADKIKRTMPGTGYLTVEDSGLMRFRTPYVSDEEIAQLVQAYAPRPVSLAK